MPETEIHFPEEGERNTEGTQGHSRTGDNEIRFNEDYKGTRAR